MSWTAAPILGARDVKRAAEHYRDVFGFEIASVFEGIGDEGGVYGIVNRAGLSIHLQIRRRELPSNRERIESDVYLYVEDADALYEELAGRGARVLRKPESEEYGLRDFVVEDLDGNRLVFGSPLTA